MRGAQAAVSVVVVWRLQQRKKGRQESGNIRYVAAVQHAVQQASHQRRPKHADNEQIRAHLPAYDAGGSAAQRALRVLEHGLS